MSNGWIGVDLDGTLAHYDGWKGPEHIGEPIKPMLERVKQWLADGKTVKIFTARVYCPAEPTSPASIVGTIRTDPASTTGITQEDAKEIEQVYAEWRERWLEVYTKVRPTLRTWLLQHVGQELEATCVKDFGMIELWDDRCVQVVPNSGISISDYIKAVQNA